MPIAIETGLGGFFYTPPAPTISVAPALIEDRFEEVDYLYLDKLSLRAAPEVDAAEFHYRYGDQIREGTATTEYYEPLDVSGYFVRIEIPATVENDEPIVWYGQVMAVSRETDGTPASENPKGTQHFVAFGLLHLLDKVVIDKSWIRESDTASFQIEAGLPFNFDQGGEYPYVGNATVITEDGSTRTVFDDEQRSNLKWSAAEVVKYLLYRLAPKNTLSLDANPWAIDPASDIDDFAAWYEFSVPTDLRTVKDVIDEVLSRKRGVSYYIRCVPDDDTSQPNKVYLVPFSFAVDNVTLPSNAVLSANPEQRTLNFEKALDVMEARVDDIATARFHYVRVFGEYMTSTFTTSVSQAPNALEFDWTAAEVTEYLEGASNAADYPAGTEDRAYRNAVARTNDKLRHVFTRFRINQAWNKTTTPWHEQNTSGILYLVAPEIGDEDATIDPVYVDPGNTAGMPLWLGGLQIERHLPFQDRFDYSGTSIDDGDHDAGFGYAEFPGFIPLLAYILTDENEAENYYVRDDVGAILDDPARFGQVEKLNHTGFHQDDGRKFAAHVHVRDTFPGVEIKSHPPQMLAKVEWEAGDPATTDRSQDPIEENGLDWRDMFVTMTIRLPKRVQGFAQILPLGIAEPIAELAIYVRDARLDWITPYTTVRVEDGIPIVTTSGGLLRDDRMRLANIARGAAEWYGDKRKLLSLTYKQVRNLFTLGWLITDIGGNYSPQGINTPITSIDYIFPGEPAPYTVIKTSFAELDYQR